MNHKILTRRDLFRRVAGAATAAYFGKSVKFAHASPSAEKSLILRVNQCPVHDGTLRHTGVDTLLCLMSDHELPLYRTDRSHPWGGPGGIIEPHDIVLIKVNCQWKFRGTTNTDVLRGLIHRILEHPDGFTGEVVIFENGQMQGSFDGDPVAWGRYKNIPEAAGVHINAEDDTLTVERLVKEVFATAPVSSCLLDSVSDTFIAQDDHTTDGYRKIAEAEISYPCFTTAGKNRVELREGIWNGKGYNKNLKLINLPVLKTHPGTGITGALKHSYGIVSMSDDETWRKKRHYEESGLQCGRMYSLVRMPDLNIVDAIWVTYQEHHKGYPPSTTYRANTLLAGLDPVALDYYGSKHILLPLGGDRAEEHNPDTFPGLINHLTGAQEFINNHGSVKGEPARQGDDNMMVVSRPA